MYFKYKDKTIFKNGLQIAKEFGSIYEQQHRRHESGSDFAKVLIMRIVKNIGIVSQLFTNTNLDKNVKKTPKKRSFYDTYKD